MHARRARIDHRFHELERIEHAAESGLGVGNNRCKPVDAVLALGMVNLVRANERVVDAAYDRGNAVGGVKGLIGIHLAREVRVGRNLPAGKVDRLQPGLDLLHGLIAGQRAKGIDERFFIDEFPELFGPTASQRVFDLHRPAKPVDVFGRVRTLHALPARIAFPVPADFCDCLIAIHGGLL